MRAYYFEGNNIDWFICLCLFLVVICVVNALDMFVIPENSVCRSAEEKH